MRHKRLKISAVLFLGLGLISLQAQTVKDIEGNIYKTVSIGTQLWMAENLKTSIFSDGKPIPLVIENGEWGRSVFETKRGMDNPNLYIGDVELTAIGYCWYDNNETEYKNTYGALYNWYTIKSGKLCPAGWRVPTEKDWSILIEFLGGDDQSWGKLKEVGTINWKEPNKAATNSSGFTARPGGFRMEDGEFRNMKYVGYWWSSTATSNSLSSYVKSLSIGWDDLKTNIGSTNKYDGLSVRCIKNSQAKELMDALINKDLKMALILIQGTDDVNYIDTKYNTTLLRIASENGDTEICKTLIERGADVNLHSDDNVTGLIAASLKGHLDIVKLLLEKGAEVDHKGTLGLTSLYCASQRGNYEIVKLLLDTGAVVDLSGDDGATPLSTASEKGHVDVVKLLLEKGAKVDSKNNKGSTPLILASLNGHTEVANLLLKNEATIELKSNDGGTALFYASQLGHTEVVKLLLDNGVEMDDINSSLIIASEKGHIQTVSLLLDKGAKIDSQLNGWTSLILASQNGHVDVVKLLLDNGAKVDLPYTGGWTALMAASQSGHTEVIKQLLDNGANPNLKYKEKTALDYAKNDKIKSLQTINSINGNGLTPESNNENSENFSNITPEQLEDVAQIVFTEPSFNFGKMKQNSTVEHNFTFKNMGGNDLLITKVYSPCICITVTPGETIIKAGGTSQIKAIFNSGTRLGKQTKAIFVTTNDPKKPNFVLIVFAEIEAPESN